MLQFDTRGAPGMPSGATGQGMPSGPAERALPPLPSPPLSPEALDAAFAPTMPAYSPIVLAGTVRLIEFLLTLLVGSAIYVAYVVPVEGFEWHYVAGILLIAWAATRPASTPNQA